MMTHQMTIADQTTCPLPTEAMALQSALYRHRLSLLQVARASGVRSLTAWRAAQGLPVRPGDAGLARLTGDAMLREAGERLTSIWLQGEILPQQGFATALEGVRRNQDGMWRRGQGML